MAVQLHHALLPSVTRYFYDPPLQSFAAPFAADTCFFLQIFPATSSSQSRDLPPIGLTLSILCLYFGLLMLNVFDLVFSVSLISSFR